MTTFTKEQLEGLINPALPNTNFTPYGQVYDLAVFALAQMEGAERAEGELTEQREWFSRERDKRYAAEAERDEAKDATIDALRELVEMRHQRDEARRELDLLTDAVRDSYEIEGDTVYAVETNEDARVEWPNHPEVLQAVRRALERAADTKRRQLNADVDVSEQGTP